MLQRSRSTGLCSRFRQREQLRAASPPEQSKLFQLALMHVEDDDEEETLPINPDNILLRGFVNLVSRDEEAEIRSKIGDIIRL